MIVKKTYIVLVVTLIWSFLFPSFAHAQAEKPFWWKNVHCISDEQHFSGLEYCTGKAPYEYIHVVVIQLDGPGLKIEYLIPNGVDGKGKPGECKDVNPIIKHPDIGCSDPKNQNWYPVMYLNQAVEKAQKDPNLAVVINGDYSACTDGPSADCPLVDKDGKPYYREHGPEGLTVVHGSRLDGSKNGDGDNNIVRRPYLIISNASPLVVELHRSNSDNGLKPYEWIYTGVGGAPWLIQDGKALSNLKDCEGANKASCRDKASQTAVGLTRDKKWMFLVVAVNAPTLTDVAKFMDEDLDAWQAIKFDGGGSSQLYYVGAKKQNVETGDGRPLTNFLAIYAQPGTGIFSDNPSEPSEPPGNSEPPSSDDNLGWWQKIQKSWTDFWHGADTWWQNQKQNVSKWWEGVKNWWKELPQRIENWLQKQFMDWLNQKLNQLCVSAGLVPATLGIVVYTRKRSRFRR